MVESTGGERGICPILRGYGLNDAGLSAAGNLPYAGSDDLSLSKKPRNKLERFI